MNTFFTCEQKLGATRIVAFFLKEQLMYLLLLYIAI